MSAREGLEGEACDLCAGTAFEVLAEDGPDNCRLVLCTGCALVQAAPRLERDGLDGFYDDVFSFDHGSAANTPGGLPDPARLLNEERLVADWALPVLDRFGGVEGRRVLDLRCRSGALTAAVSERAQAVAGLEPFEANVNHARRVRGLDCVRVLPFSRFHELPLGELGIASAPGFDVVNALAHHVLAHLLSPRALLLRIFELLRPGGLLLLDEKDVLHPWRYKTRSPLDTGRAHQFHLTRDTTEAYLRAAGFEVLACEIDRRRRSDFRHVLAAARRPAGADRPAWAGASARDADRVRRTRARLAVLGRSWWLRCAFHRRRHKLSKRLASTRWGRARGAS